MPLNRFSPGKEAKLDLRTGNFIWQHWLRLRAGREEKTHKGSAWGEKWKSILQCWISSASCPTFSSSPTPLFFQPLPSSPCLLISSADSLTVAEDEAKLSPSSFSSLSVSFLTRVNVSPSEGAATHSKPFDLTPPHMRTTEEKMDKIDDRPQLRGQVQGHGKEPRRRWC